MKDPQGSPTDKVRAAKAQIMVPSLNLPAKESLPSRNDKSKSPHSDESQQTSLPNSARSMTDSSGIPSARSAMSANSSRGVEARMSEMAARISQSARRPGELPKTPLQVSKAGPSEGQSEADLWKARCVRLQKQLEEAPDIRLARLEVENRLLREKLKKTQEMTDYMRMRDRMNREKMLEADERNKDLQLQLAKTERLVRELRSQGPSIRPIMLSRVFHGPGTPRETASPLKAGDQPAASGKSTPRGPGSTPRETLSPSRGYTPRSLGSTPRDQPNGSGNITPAGGSRPLVSPRDTASASIIEELQRANAELRRRLSANTYTGRPKLREKCLAKGPKGTSGAARSRVGAKPPDEDVDGDSIHADGLTDSDRLRIQEGCCICRGQRRVSFNDGDVRKEEEGYLSDSATLGELKEVLKSIQNLVAATRRRKSSRTSSTSMSASREAFSISEIANASNTLITLTRPEDSFIDVGSLD